MRLDLQSLSSHPLRQKFTENNPNNRWQSSSYRSGFRKVFPPRWLRRREARRRTSPRGGNHRMPRKRMFLALLLTKEIGSIKRRAHILFFWLLATGHPLLSLPSITITTGSLVTILSFQLQFDLFYDSTDRYRLLSHGGKHMNMNCAIIIASARRDFSSNLLLTYQGDIGHLPYEATSFSSHVGFLW